MKIKDSYNVDSDERFIISENMDFPNKIETYEMFCVVDTVDNLFYFVVDNFDNVEIFINKLNNIVEENEKLKYDIDKNKSKDGSGNERAIKLIDEKINELNEINCVSLFPRESIVVLEDLKKRIMG